MTIGEFISAQSAALHKVGIDSARLDILILLEAALGWDRSHILAHTEDVIPAPILDELNTKCIQRMSHLPLSYLTKTAHFYGRTFFVDTHVLVPRPESEAMIALLKTLDIPAGSRIADIGTGSGCLGITAGLELPDVRVILCDISFEALAVAQHNADLLGLDCTVAETDLLDGCPMPQDILLANLPYVPDAYPINKAAAHEPALALFSGEDGLDDYRLLWQQITALPVPPNAIITESLSQQHEPLAALAAAAGYQQKGQADGLAQLFIRAHA